MEEKFEFIDPNEMDLIKILIGMRNYSKYCLNEVRDECVSMFEKHNLLPKYLRADANSKLKFELGHDREFCEMAGISYVNIDDHWREIDTALFLFYRNQLKDHLKEIKR